MGLQKIRHNTHLRHRCDSKSVFAKEIFIRIHGRLRCSCPYTTFKSVSSQVRITRRIGSRGLDQESTGRIVLPAVLSAKTIIEVATSLHQGCAGRSFFTNSRSFHSLGPTSSVLLGFPPQYMLFFRAVLRVVLLFALPHYVKK